MIKNGWVNIWKKINEEYDVEREKNDGSNISESNVKQQPCSSEQAKIAQ